MRGETAVPAVADLSMTVPRGEVFGFLGPNGAGKTTSVKMLLGLTPPSSGEAWQMVQEMKNPLPRFCWAVRAKSVSLNLIEGGALPGTVSSDSRNTVMSRFSSVVGARKSGSVTPKET